jgi:HAD superfamily hydrolase (TIGR01509 family)
LVRPIPRRTARRFPRAVLIDMDDTIFDHSLTCRDALAHVREEYDVFGARTLDELWREYGRLLGVTHVDVMLGRRSAEEVRAERFRRLAAGSGTAITPKKAAELSRVYREWYRRVRRAVPGAPEAVRRLHARVPVAVVTNNTVAEQVEKIGFLGLGGAIDALVTSEEVGVAKPGAGIFRAALERTGVAADASVMVGDSWTSDVVGARDAGIRAIWFNRFREPRPEAARVVEFRSFRSPERLIRLISKA